MIKVGDTVYITFHKDQGIVTRIYQIGRLWVADIVNEDATYHYQPVGDLKLIPTGETKCNV